MKMTGLAKRLSFAVAAVLLAVAVGAADGPRRAAYRPNVVEVGPPRVLSPLQFEWEMSVNSDLRSWVTYYGYPDVAEYQEVVPQVGWADYEIHTYYVRRNQALVFGRVVSFPYAGTPDYPGYTDLLPGVGLLKFQGTIAREDLDRLSAPLRR